MVVGYGDVVQHGLGIGDLEVYSIAIPSSIHCDFYSIIDYVTRSGCIVEDEIHIVYFGVVAVQGDDVRLCRGCACAVASEYDGGVVSYQVCVVRHYDAGVDVVGAASIKGDYACEVIIWISEWDDA